MGDEDSAVCDSREAHLAGKESRELRGGEQRPSRGSTDLHKLLHLSHPPLAPKTLLLPRGSAVVLSI